MACKAISVSVKVLTLDDKREIQFGLTKGCNPDDTSFWLIDFLLKEKKGDEMKTRVEVHVKVGTEKKEKKAEELADTKELTDKQITLLFGRIADRAKELRSGTKSDPELDKLLLRLLS